MSSLLLDTTVLIDSERSDGYLRDVIGDDDTVAIAAVTVAELLVGVHLATTHRRAQRQAFVEAVIETIPVVAYDTEVAVKHAMLLAEARREGRPRGAHDLIIAATARATNRTVVTADATGFADLSGVDVIRPR